MMIKGKDIKIQDSTGEIFALATTCDISFSADLEETANYTSGKWKKYKATRNGWSVNHGGFVAVGTVKKAKALIGTEVTLTLTDGEDRLTGTAIVQQAQVQAQVGSLARYTLNLQGSGELTEVT